MTEFIPVSPWVTVNKGDYRVFAFIVEPEACCIEIDVVDAHPGMSKPFVTCFVVVAVNHFRVESYFPETCCDNETHFDTVEILFVVQAHPVVLDAEIHVDGKRDSEQYQEYLRVFVHPVVPQHFLFPITNV